MLNLLYNGMQSTEEQILTCDALLVCNTLFTSGYTLQKVIC